jgi:hypothetical protein
MASGGFALRSALSSTAVIGRRRWGAATDALTTGRRSLVSWSMSSALEISSS